MNDLEKAKQQNIETRQTQVGLLRPGTIFYTNGEEFEIVENEPTKSSHVVVKDKLGNKKEIYSYDVVDEVVIDSLSQT